MALNTGEFPPRNPDFRAASNNELLPTYQGIAIP